MAYLLLYLSTASVLVKAIFLAEEKGLLDDVKSRAFNVAFLSQIFAQNPTKLEGWLQDFKPLKEAHKGIIWTALWLANTEASKKQAVLYKKQLSYLDQSLIEQMPLKLSAIDSMEINSANVLEMLWGSFMITGEEGYVIRIISALPISNPTPNDVRNDLQKVAVSQTAKWTLVSNAMQHKRVLAICMKARETFPELKTMLNEVIDDATNLKEFKHGFSSVLQSFIFSDAQAPKT